MQDGLSAGLGLCSPEMREQSKGPKRESCGGRDTAGLRRQLHFLRLWQRKSSQNAEQETDRAPGSSGVLWPPTFGTHPRPPSRPAGREDRQTEAKQRSGITRQEEHQAGGRKASLPAAGLHLPGRGEQRCPAAVLLSPAALCEPEPLGSALLWPLWC